MANFEKFKPVEIPPVSEETKEKIKQKPEIPPITEQTAEKIREKPEIPEITPETAEKIKQKPEIPPLPENLRSFTEKREKFSKLPELPEELEPPQTPVSQKSDSFLKKFGRGAKRGAKYAGIGAGGLFGISLVGIWLFFKEIKESIKDFWEKVIKRNF